MDRYAVIGQPIAHSLSPRIHGRFAAQLGVRVCYEAVEVSPERLEVMLQRLHAERYLGLNVTLPHKAAVVALCEAHSARVDLAGAANTLIRTVTGWRADNTDGEGLLLDLDRLQIPIENRRVLVLGVGGAARGVLGPLLSRAPRELVLSNRTPWKPESLAQRFALLGPIRPSTYLALKGDQFDLIINATAAGHQGEVAKLPGGVLAAGACAYDLSYGKAALPFLEWARSKGAACVTDGLGMLVEQAASSFALWRGVRPQTKDLFESLQPAGQESPMPIDPKPAGGLPGAC